jgi:predicted cupin superfamily sugar epimerase
MHPEALRLVDQLSLVAHPEGGYYREIHRTSHSTAIYFLLPSGVFSALHRIPQPELWHHYAGDPVDLHIIDETGAYRVERLGSSFARGERPLIVVPPNQYQAAMPIGDRYALCGCTVAPPFAFTNLELPTRADLLARFPAHAAAIVRLTRE